MDNFRFDVTCTGDEALAKAMELAFLSDHEDMREQTATHYIIDPEKGLVFLWHHEAGAVAFPFPLGVKEATAMAAGYLDKSKYPPPPDFDGSTQRGWRVYNDGLGHVGDCQYAIIAVKTEWAFYGK